MAHLWLPEIVRSEPRRPLRARYRALAGVRSLPVPSRCQPAVESALHAAGARWRQLEPLSWEVDLRWTTPVLGLIRRNVVERVVLRLVSGPEGGVLELEGSPQATHSAHAAGFAGVLVLAAGAWVATGWLTGIPAGLTTAIAGGLWADTTRRMALATLERRLLRLLDDVGRALWPGAVAELL